MTVHVHSARRLFLLAIAFAPAAGGQAVPNVQGASSYQGFHLPTVGGTMSYSVTLSGNASKGSYGASDVSGFTSVSGNLALLTTGNRHPFSMVYSGGYFADLTGNAPSSVFQTLSLSQVLTRGRWIYTVADSVSYLPQTATTGLAGVPGVGDTGTPPVDVGTGTGQGVLSYNQARVSNSAIGSAQRRLTGSTSLAGTGSYSISRFLGSSGTSATPINTDQYGAGVSMNHRLDARTAVGASYLHAHSTFPRTADSSSQAAFGLISSFSSDSFTVDYTRSISRKLSVFASAGPQWTSVPRPATPDGLTGTGTSINATISAGLSYSARSGAATVGYSRGSNSGSGIVSGANTDSVQTSASRRLSRLWNASASLSYSRSSSLIALSNSQFTSNALVATVQANRAVGRHLSAYGSYTAQRQTTRGQAVSSIAFSGLSQTIAAGLTYSPGVIGHGRR